MAPTQYRQSSDYAAVVLCTSLLFTGKNLFTGNTLLTGNNPMNSSPAGRSDSLFPFQGLSPSETDYEDNLL